jgi:hypothetical protein
LETFEESDDRLFNGFRQFLGHRQVPIDDEFPDCGNEAGKLSLFRQNLKEVSEAGLEGEVEQFGDPLQLLGVDRLRTFVDLAAML